MSTAAEYAEAAELAAELAGRAARIPAPAPAAEAHRHAAAAWKCYAAAATAAHRERVFSDRLAAPCARSWAVLAGLHAVAAAERLGLDTEGEK